MAGSALVQKHIAALAAMKGKSVEAGWFESDRYPASGDKSVGEQVARIARIMEYGAAINHPGGTKYIEDAAENGRYLGTRFVHKDFKGEHKVTKAHVIVIPARPFMRLAWTKFKQQRLKIQAKIAKDLINKKIEPNQALAQIGMALEDCIADSIKNGGWQSNSPSTISKKGFDKPLIDTAHMWKSVNSKVT
jgi:hypothetical protein